MIVSTRTKTLAHTRAFAARGGEAHTLQVSECTHDEETHRSMALRAMELALEARGFVGKDEIKQRTDRGGERNGLQRSHARHRDTQIKRTAPANST